MPHTIVIGAGWSGLTCAYRLSQAGHKVTVLEAAPQSGGRARGINWQANRVDNGQHVVINAYHALLKLLSDLNVRHQDCFKILPLRIIQAKIGTIDFATQFGKYSLAMGIIRASLLNWQEKLAALRFCLYLWRYKFKLKQDCTLQNLLQELRQPRSLISKFWEPLALAAMTTPIEIASAQVFANILQQIYYMGSDNQWYIPNCDLSSLLPDKLEFAIKANGGQILLNHVVTALGIKDNICYEVRCKEQVWSADNVVMATSAWQATKLCAPHSILNKITQNIKQFVFQPITTIYFEFNQNIELPHPIMGIINTRAQWVFSRACVGQANILSVVVSGPNASTDNQDNLAQQVLTELQQHVSNLPDCMSYKVICEKRAAFECSVDLQGIRPNAITPINNLWLCGDYIQNGLPATLEGAVINGEEVAKLVSARPEIYRLAQTIYCDDSNLVGNKIKQGDIALS